MTNPTLSPTLTPEEPRPVAVRSKSQQRRHNRYVIAPLVLIGVNVVLFLVFFVWPGALGLIYSFTDYRGVGKLNFIGLANFQKLFADTTFYAALSRTFLYTVLSVPLTYVISLGIAALLVTKAARGKTAAKVIIFLPWLISPIVVGVIWRWMFGQDFGFVNFVHFHPGREPGSVVERREPGPHGGHLRRGLGRHGVQHAAVHRSPEEHPRGPSWKRPSWTAPTPGSGS